MARGDKREAEQREESAPAEPRGDEMSGSDVKATEDKVRTAVERETEQGYRGERVDQTPNSHYTVEGVTSDKPVPETEADPVAARREAMKRSDES